MIIVHFVASRLPSDIIPEGAWNPHYRYAGTNYLQRRYSDTCPQCQMKKGECQGWDIAPALERAHIDLAFRIVHVLIVGGEKQKNRKSEFRHHGTKGHETSNRKVILHKFGNDRTRITQRTQSIVNSLLTRSHRRHGE